LFFINIPIYLVEFSFFVFTGLHVFVPQSGQLFATASSQTKNSQKFRSCPAKFLLLLITDSDICKH